MEALGAALLSAAMQENGARCLPFQNGGKCAPNEGSAHLRGRVTNAVEGIGFRGRKREIYRSGFASLGALMVGIPDWRHSLGVGDKE